ncbi:hypothetical protein B0H11DRAFT_1937417 [Mycena galericulata]|nr:hypothetical protein B0H11DRAFT_1937417 [Mycena galericulata]
MLMLPSGSHSGVSPPFPAPVSAAVCVWMPGGSVTRRTSHHRVPAIAPFNDRQFPVYVHSRGMLAPMQPAISQVWPPVTYNSRHFHQADGLKNFAILTIFNNFAEMWGTSDNWKNLSPKRNGGFS